MILKIDNKNEIAAKEIYDVFQISYAIEAELLNIKEFPPLKRLVHNIQLGNTEFYGYFKDSQLVAVVEIDQIEKSIDICALVVHPSYFRQGIANKLLEFISGINLSKFITVETGFDNLPAILLYEKSGFERNRIWKTDDGIKKISFTKNVDQKITP